jgi:hypothetical protein
MSLTPCVFYRMVTVWWILATRTTKIVRDQSSTVSADNDCPVIALYFLFQDIVSFSSFSFMHLSLLLAFPRLLFQSIFPRT